MRKAKHVGENISYSNKGPLPKDLLKELRTHRWDREPKAWAA
jgi:hypothetical protein